jgi:malate permease and related proteins
MLQANSVFIVTLGIILMGFLIKKYNYITETEGKVISRFLMHTTFPALMIISTARVKLEAALAMIPFLCLLLGACSVLSAWWIFRNQSVKLRGILLMGAGGLNVGLFGFPLIEGIWGTEALVYAVMFDIGNTIMTFGVVYPIGSYFARESTGKIGIQKILKRVFSLPPVTGMFIGLLINILQIPLPEIAFKFLEVLAGANKALVLLLMGIYLSFELNKAQMKFIAKLLGIRYFFGLVAVGLLYYFLEPSLMQSVLIVLVILPLGMTILPFSDEFGFDSRIAGTLVNLSLLISFAIIWSLVLVLDLGMVNN